MIQRRGGGGANDTAASTAQMASSSASAIGRQQGRGLGGDDDWRRGCSSAGCVVGVRAGGPRRRAVGLAPRHASGLAGCGCAWPVRAAMSTLAGRQPAPPAEISAGVIRQRRRRPPPACSARALGLLGVLCGPARYQALMPLLPRSEPAAAPPAGCSSVRPSSQGVHLLLGWRRPAASRASSCLQGLVPAAAMSRSSAGIWPLSCCALAAVQLLFQALVGLGVGGVLLTGGDEGGDAALQLGVAGSTASAF